jgi:CDP-paratose 2-epimerase
MSSVVVVTGSAGLIGSEAVRHFAGLGMDVVGVDNDMRGYFFGKDGSTKWNLDRLQKEIGDRYTHHDIDIRDREALARLFAGLGREVGLVIHAAAQPSHDWAAREPFTDFDVNAVGTLNMLEAVRQNCADAPFIFTSTNKVYGDLPNSLPLVEQETRWELPADHKWYNGIDETMSIDQCLHSVFGASKVAADVMVQEYGKYFGLKTGVFRGGCLTGPAHAGAELHGFLSYLMRATVSGRKYTIYGYDGKQVRDNIHSVDVVRAFQLFHEKPRVAAVYNLGGGRRSNVSMLEAIEKCQQISGRELDYELSDQARMGDHRWWVTDLSEFQRDYPSFELTYGIDEVLREIYEVNVEAWSAEAAAT